MKNYAENFSLYLYASIVILFLSNYTLGQTASIVGKVQDNFQESLPYATIKIPQLNIGTIADEHGDFEIKNVPVGKHKITIYLKGFQDNSQTITLVENQTLELLITLNIEDLIDGVEVFGNRYVRPDKIENLTRLPLKIHDQIQSISVISDKLIKEQGALTIAEVAHNVPGVYTFATYGNKRESMSSRGFRGIPILKNGVRVNSDFRGYGILTDMQGVDNMQVLKGASAITQGVATDLGSPGGVINIVTKTPKFYTGGSVGLRLGSFGQARATFDVYSPINKEKTLAFRINGAVEAGQTYRSMVKGDKIYINPSLKWLVGKNTTVTMEMDYFNDGRTPDLGTINLGENDVNLIYDLPTSQFLGYKNDRSNTLNTTYAVRLDHQLTDKLQLNAALYHSNLSLKDKGASLGKVVEIGGEKMYNIRERGYSVAHREDKNTVVQLDFTGNELKTGFMTHTFQVGMDFRTNQYSTLNQNLNVLDTLNVFEEISTALPQINLPTGTTASAESRSLGFVAQDVIGWTSWFKTFLGVRLSRTEVITGTENNLSYAINPLGGVVFTPFKNINVLGSYTNSSYPRTASRLGIDGKELGTERFDQIEVGIKSHWFKERFHVNITFFKINNTDINLPVYDENWVETGYYQKGGNDQRQGIEIELTGRVLENLELIAGYAYLDAQYKEHTSYVRGSSPLNTPKHTANAYVNYKFKDRIFKGLTLGAGVYYIGERPINDWSSGAVTHEGIVPGQKPFYVKAYTQVNAQVSYSLKRNWTFRFIANNIFDEIGYNAYRTSYINQTNPRNFAVSIEYNF